MNSETEVLTLKRAARRIGVSSRWLRAEALAGRVPCIQADGRFVFELESLAAVLAHRIRAQAVLPGRSLSPPAQ